MGRKIYSGFGLVEALVATGIIALVSASALSLVSLNSKGTRQLSQKIIAKNLAAEALEAVRVTRDSIYVKNDPAVTWQSVYNSVNSQAADFGYAFANNNQTISLNSNPVTTQLKIGSATQTFTTTLALQRVDPNTADLQPADSGSGLLVTATVTWPDAQNQTKKQSYGATTLLTDNQYVTQSKN